LQSADIFVSTLSAEPIRLDWTRNNNHYKVKVRSIRRHDKGNGLVIDVKITKNGIKQNYNAPWIVINPPIWSNDPLPSLHKIVRSFAESLK